MAYRSHARARHRTSVSVRVCGSRSGAGLSHRSTSPPSRPAPAASSSTDRAQFDVENWAKSGPSGGYHAYTNGRTTVLIDQDITVARFAEGTCISTPSGEVAVEALRINDRVRPASGGMRPIRWIGRQRLDLSRHANPRLAHPIRILAEAIAKDVPSRGQAGRRAVFCVRS